MFPDFVLPSFVPPSPTRTTSRTRSRMVCMGGAEEITKTTMEVNSIVAKVANENTQVAPNTIKVATKTMHPSTLSTIKEIEKGT